ncbi:hypothetical protein NXY56_003510 [Leishmania guyanensis]|uniref:Uncharacterized protein n=5 Tax=Viannia TaxID=37616 RepID=A4HDY8_LEIBR|nr:conserved hypothetical protein [Leishmania braziliensis MHOM/BR/75/M2904]KAI5690216.1 hypothetical protein MNV84_04376 [Leishmania braziliensis]CCM16096.1 hypothetical protein, conserved [Leishmania guyanensis]CAJ2474022.1 unnamed protein product [Leishmania braziliensis]CAJ2474535.1 unnamed protein product [Leishmania braziliensis]CAM39040.1 conserved hypothetical protein [Leishmania braziliensis MHOM/BR/75/M2904]
MHSVAKRKEQAVVVAVGPAPQMRMCADVLTDVQDEPVMTEEELRAWSEFDRSRPTSPSPVVRNGNWRLPKRYQGVFQERYILMILALTLLLFIASTYQMDTKTELEEIKRTYGIDDAIKLPTKRTGHRNTMM